MILQQIKTVNITDENAFEKEVNNLLHKGWRVSSTACGFCNSESYDFCTSFQAVLVREVEVKSSDEDY